MFIIERDILTLIFSFINYKKDFLSVFLTCKQWYELGFTYLDMTLHIRDAVLYASYKCNHSLLNNILKNKNIEKVPIKMCIYSALGIAAAADNLSMIRTLISFNLTTKKENGVVFSGAFEGKKYRLIEKLMDEDDYFEPSCFDRNFLKLVARSGDVQLVKKVLDSKKIDVTANDFTLFRNSVYYYDHLAVETLLKDERIKPSSDTLCNIVSYSDTKMMEILLPHLENKNDVLLRHSMNYYLGDKRIVYKLFILYVIIELFIIFTLIMKIIALKY